jgi:hypothetical protein
MLQLEGLMNQITTLQNAKFPLQLLAAQRQLYASAKTLMGWQLALSGPVATLAAILGIAVPATREFVALLAATVLLLDALWFTPRSKRLREAAARVQERFDCDVLSMKWDATRVGSPEPNELVLEQATRYALWATKMPPLTDWYPRVVGRVPLPLARLICQRTNCWWDAKQRRHYAVSMAGLLLACTIAVFWSGLAAKLTMTDLILVVILPMLSTVKIAHQQWTEHREAADRLDRLRDRVERVWKDALADPSKPELDEDQRALQSEIFDCRKRNPPVFDFIFKRLRDSHEAQMNFGAEHLVMEVERSQAAR